MIPGQAQQFFEAAAAQSGAAAGYEVERSLRFNSGDTAYLNRTPSSAGNRKTWTWSGWVKLAELGTGFYTIFQASSDDFRISSNLIGLNNSGTALTNSTAVLRDPSAWYHVVLVVDNTQSSNRTKIYVNNEIVAQGDTYSLNEDTPFNNTVAHYIGRNPDASGREFDGYLADVHFIDGQALAPTDFGEFDDNNVWQPKEYSGTYGTNGFRLDFSDNSSNAALGYDAAATQPAVAPKGGMDVVTYTGNGSTQTISGLAFQPDFVWLKSRSNNNNNFLVDSVRGPDKRLVSDLTSAESTVSNGVTSLNSDGWTVGSNSDANQSGQNFVGWAWKAGGTAVSNTDGTITSSVSANTDYGFSIVSYTGNGTAGATIGHGLNGPIGFMVIKNRDSAYQWLAWHKSFNGNNYIPLNTTDAVQTNSAIWNGTSPSSSVITLGTNVSVNENTSDHIGYCWSEVSGFSKFDTYSGGTANQTISTGFKPRYLLIRRTDAANSWLIFDSARGVNKVLKAESNLAETTASTGVDEIEFLSNGFKLVSTNNGINGSGGTYIYAAFADRPGNNWTPNNLVAEQPTTLPGVRFTGSSSDFLSHPTSTDFDISGDFTLEAYVNLKASNGSGASTIAGKGTNSWILSLNTSRQINFAKYGVSLILSGSTAVSTGEWTHIAVTRSGTDVKGFINGVLDVSATSSLSFSNTNSLYIGNDVSNTSQLFNGTISNLRLVNGTALYTSNFTPPTAPLANVTNTKLLCCQSSSSATAATVAPGTITANGNAFATEFSDSTSANDSLIDTPTNYTAASGNNGGNYATLNPVDKGGDSSATVTDGNLKWFGGTTTNHAISRSTIGVSSGKWYVEVTIEDASDTSGRDRVGVVSSEENVSITNPVIGNFSTGYGYRSDGFKENNGSSSSYGASYTTGDTIGIALDMDTGSLVFYKNGSSQGTAYTSIGGTMHFCGTPRENGTYVFNFGQRPFAYTPPTGYKSLCTTNLADPTIADGSTAMDAKLYTGNGSTQTISGLGFSPDLVWTKCRSFGRPHALMDIIRGGNKYLGSSETAAEGTLTNMISSFNSDGYTLGVDSQRANESGQTYVAWAWDGGTSTVSNTDGSITSNVRANQSAGFSIVTYTGTGSLATIGHGLNAAPELILFKSRTNSENWAVYSKANGAGNRLILNLNVTSAAGSNYFNNTEATSSVFTVNTVGQANGSGQNYVAYCFAPVEGYSAFGKYTGNGSTDGPFVYTGFRPRFILVKITSGIADDWTIIDSERIGYNDDNYWLYASSSSAEYSGSFSASDILSNGFKPRSTGNQFNASGSTYIYAAFGDPFKTARAR